MGFGEDTLVIENGPWSLLLRDSSEIMPQTAQYNTSIAGWSFALARALDSYGIDSSRVFSDAGIQLAAVESPAQRLAVSSVQQVWRYAMDHTDGNFGITVASYLTPASFHALGYALWSSSTLKEAFERLIRYRCVISHMFFCELEQEEGGYRLALVDERSIKSEVTTDAFLGFLILLGRELDRGDFAPVSLRLARPSSRVSDQLRDFFATDIEFDAADYSLAFSAESLHRPLKHGNPELAGQLDTLVERYIGELGLISEYMLRVKTEIHRLLSIGGVSIEQVAETLNVTVRTLQRRLSAEQGSYNKLLDQVRFRLSIEYLRNPGANATEIAFKLGFNDSGSFSRSFKRWTGKSVSDYRDEAAGARQKEEE